MKKREDVWWHIAAKDGSYLSRARFPTERAAVEEMAAAPKTYPRDSHVPVKVVYVWEI